MRVWGSRRDLSGRGKVEPSIAERSRPNSPHDPIAVLTAVQPELFTFARGWVRVNSEGVTSLERHDDGPHRMVVDLDSTVVAQEVLSRICRAQTGQNVGPT